jgi:hypothetical protein
VATARAEARHLHRTLSTWVDDDGMVVIRGRLTPEAGAVVQRALEAASDQLFRESQGAAKAGVMADEVTPGQRRADALGCWRRRRWPRTSTTGRLATAVK